jgi:hypothetical protein
VLPVTYGQFVAREKLAALFTDPPPAPAVPLPERSVHDPTRPTAVDVLPHFSLAE